MTAGRITEPAVCVPSANGAICAATAAADPLDEPPGVCSTACGLRVGARREIGEFCGDCLAEHKAAGCAQCGDARGVGMRHTSGVDRRAMFGADPGSVDDILYRNRQSRQRTDLRPVKLARDVQGALRVDPSKRVHFGFALLDCVDERMRDRLAGHFARRDHARSCAADSG